MKLAASISFLIKKESDGGILFITDGTACAFGERCCQRFTSTTVVRGTDEALTCDVSVAARA